jgi:hypothetical protein
LLKTSETFKQKAHRKGRISRDARENTSPEPLNIWTQKWLGIVREEGNRGVAKALKVAKSLEKDIQEILLSPQKDFEVFVNQIYASLDISLGELREKTNALNAKIETLDHSLQEPVKQISSVKTEIRDLTFARVAPRITKGTRKPTAGAYRKRRQHSRTRHKTRTQEQEQRRQEDLSTSSSRTISCPCWPSLSTMIPSLDFA